MVGKYVELPDAYKSINEALLHAGVANNVKVKIDYVDAEKLENDDSLFEHIKAADAVLVPGGFGERGTWVKWKRFAMPAKTMCLIWGFVWECN